MSRVLEVTVILQPGNRPFVRAPATSGPPITTRPFGSRPTVLCQLTLPECMPYLSGPQMTSRGDGDCRPPPARPSSCCPIADAGAAPAEVAPSRGGSVLGTAPFALLSGGVVA